MGEHPDVIAVLFTDHREVEQVFTELEQLRGAAQADGQNHQQVKTLAERAVIQLVRHSVAEEDDGPGRGSARRQAGKRPGHRLHERLGSGCRGWTTADLDQSSLRG
ncbi:hypothetical protein [Nonomuraea sp. SYSU D8015]|uniref:hypothetical protein n=1 Tax=Nonomuraea sp. SYSU D8015 TaxID=2593644 RepID=UPI0016610857|nr:hypothetical protein [Nonomuraea sp. SYSU D8015]